MAMLMENEQEAVHANARAIYHSLQAFWELGKPRINALLLFSAFCAMVAARHGVPPLRPTLVGLLGLGLACAGAAMVNMWFDRDIDRVMERTQNRPLPQGEMAPSIALVAGLVLGLVGFVTLDVGVGPLTAWLTVAGYLYYAVIYTMWLKRRTPQNIVIGGGAGAIPSFVGWAAVTGHLAPLAWLLFLIVFLWTPSHFWGLALYRSEDYRRASVPMMPVVRGARTTIAQMLFYAFVLAGVDLAVSHFVVHPGLYLAVASALNAWFVAVHIRLALARSQIAFWAKRTFLASLVYLPVALLCAAVANL